MVGYLETPNTKKAAPSALRQFRRDLIERFHGDLAALNDAFGTSYVDWESVTVIAPTLLVRSDRQAATPLDLAIADFSAHQPIANRVYFSVEGFYKVEYLKAHYPDIAAFNEHHKTHYGSYADVHLDRRLPVGDGRTDAERATWEEFTRTTLNLLWLRADPSAAGIYQQYLKAKYQTIAALNGKYQTEYGSFETIPLVDIPPAT